MIEESNGTKKKGGQWQRELSHGSETCKADIDSEERCSTRVRFEGLVGEYDLGLGVGMVVIVSTVVGVSKVEILCATHLSLSQIEDEVWD